MSDKTPGHVLYEQFDHTDYPPQDWSAATDKEHWENCAAAVIAHVRPQIEAEARLVIEQKNARIASCEAALEEANQRVSEARAAAVEDSINAVIPFINNNISRDIGRYLSDILRALASALPGYVCIEDKPIGEILGSDPYDERDGARMTPAAWKAISKLPKGTKIYAARAK